MRQPLHIRIDPSPYDSKLVISPDSTSPSPESAPLSNPTTRTTPSSSASDQDDFSVLCVYDFQAADPDQLSFRKNEILSIVKREETGWWAAMRKGGDIIGWIPQAFVKPLSEEMAERLVNVREELRYYEYSAEQLYLAPISRNDYIFESELEPMSKHSKVGTSVVSCCITPVEPVCSYRPGPSNYQNGTSRIGVKPSFWPASAAP
jgi:son of sevenless-like protein